MSLPPATKDISDKPAANAVTRPTDPVAKEADVSRKAKLYQAVTAFGEGKTPSNAQIEDALNYALVNSPVDQAKLSVDGQTLVRDAQVIIETIKRIIVEKNRDELVQEFIWNTRDLDASQANLKGVKAPISKDQATQDGQQAAEHLRTLGKLIFTNSEFRKLLKDATILGRDIAADAATKAATLARPNEDALRNVDEPAPSNSWEGPNGEIAGPGDAVPSTGLSALRKKGQEAAGEAAAAVNETADTAAPLAGQVQRDANTEGGVGQDTKETAEATKQNVKSKLLGRIPQEHKDKAKEQYTAGLDYLKEKMPEERRQRFIYRLKKVVLEQQRHRAYQDAVEFFLTLAETYKGHASGVASQSGDKGTAITSNPAFKTAFGQLRTLLERFANNQSIQPIFDAIDNIYKAAQQDEELRTWLKSLDQYIRRLLQEPGYIMKPEADEDGRKTFNSGRKFWDDKYKSHRQQLFNEVSTFFTAFARDPLNDKLGKDVKKLTTDLLLDSEGNFKYKPHLWSDIRSVILPAIVNQIGYFPIPRIEYVDNQIDLVIENLVLDATNIIPNIIEVQAQTYFKLSPFASIKDKSKHSIAISFSQVQSDIRQVAFYFRKKTGWPTIRDQGIADVLLSGKGLSGHVHIETVDSPTSVFKVKDVKVKVDKLKFSIKDSRHQILYATLRPLATGLIKKQIAKAIQDAIRGGLQQVDAQLVDIRERLDQAGGEGQPTRTEVLKNTFSSKKEAAEADAKSKAETAKETADKRNSTFKLVTKRDEKMVDWASANSMVEKVGAAQEQDQSSEKWHSIAFDLEAHNKPRTTV